MRQRPYTCASFAFMFDEVYEFQAGETLTLRYRLVIANGGWDAGRVEAVAGEWRGTVGVRGGIRFGDAGCSDDEMDETLRSLTAPLCVAAIS